MEKKYLTIILVLLILLVIGSTCMIYAAGNYNLIGETLSSWDGTYSISVPLGWEKSDNRASINALIAAERSDSEMYTQMSLDTYDYVGLYGSAPSNEVFTDNYIAFIAGNSDSPETCKVIEKPKKMSAGDLEGLYFEIQALSDDLNVVVFGFAAHTDQGYVTIETMARESDMAEARDIARNIIRSFEMNFPEAETPDTAEQAA